MQQNKTHDFGDIQDTCWNENYLIVIRKTLLQISKCYFCAMACGIYSSLNLLAAKSFVDWRQLYCCNFDKPITREAVGLKLIMDISLSVVIDCTEFVVVQFIKTAHEIMLYVVRRKCVLVLFTEWLILQSLIFIIVLFLEPLDAHMNIFQIDPIVTSTASHCGFVCVRREGGVNLSLIRFQRSATLHCFTKSCVQTMWHFQFA